MTTLAAIGHGSTFSTGDGNSPEVFTALDAEITSITPPGMTRDAIDASHMQSPSAWREHIAGMKDGGEISFEFNFKPGGAGLLALMTELGLSATAAAKNRRIVFPDLSYFTFSAFLTNLEPEAAVDDKMTASATYKVTGIPTLTQI